MANKYCNLIGTNKIKDEYPKITEGFDKVQQDVDAIDSRVDTIITTPIDGEAAAQELVDARGGETTLRDRLDAQDADLLSLKQQFQASSSTETTEHADIFSLPSTVVQGTMKGKLKGNTDEDCISVQPQEIKSVGKNLFSEQWRQGDISGSSDIRISTDSPVYVEKGKTYKVTSNSTSNYQVSFGFCLSRGGAVVQTTTWNVTEFIPNNDSWVYPVIRNAGNTALTVQELINSGYKLQIEQGTIATTYEPYQESKAYLKYPLRSVPNGTCDEVDLQSGKLTKRCEEYVLKASDIAGIAPYTTLDYVQLNKPTDFVGYNNLLNYNASIIIPGFTGKDPIMWDAAENIGGFFNQSAGLIAYLGVPKGTYANLAAAQAALAGTKIVYQLAEPRVIENALTNPLTVYPSGTITMQPKKQYVLKAEDITQVITSNVNNDLVIFKKKTDDVLYQKNDTLIGQIDFPGFRNGVGADTVAAIGTIYNTWVDNPSTYYGLIVAKGTYANLAAAQADLAGTIITYETKPELSTIPVTVHSEPINIAGAVKSESDRNTRQDEQINDIMLLLDYLIVVNA